MSVFASPAGVTGSVFAGGGFSPRKLFAAGEVGVWYDPSDISTLFTNTAGTTPVASPGDAVALMLDKSKGLALGPELVTNGTFDSDTTGWSQVGGGSFAWDASGGIACSDVAGSDCNAQCNITTVAGRSYLFTWTVRSSTGTWLARIRNSADYAGPATTATGSYRVIFTAGITGTNTVNLVQADTNTTTVFDNISVRELAGNHATQGTLAARPIYRIDVGGRPYLEFDGTDDGMLTGTITPGADKVQVFAGVRRVAEATGAVLEHSANINSNNGSIALLSAGYLATGANRWGFVSKGTTVRQADSPQDYAAPRTDVLAGLGDIAGDSVALRVNGTQVASSASDQGTGDYLAYPLYIGRRGGTTLPFNGWMYGLILRFGATNLDAAQISNAERWLARKTGVVL